MSKTLECGCVIWFAGSFTFCHLHDAAPRLLEALKGLFTIVGEGLIEGDFDNANRADIEAQHDLAHAAIQAAITAKSEREKDS